MRLRLIPVFLFSIAISHPLLSQNTDSLTLLLDTATGVNKVKTLNELFRAHLLGDPVQAVGYAREALILATEINDSRGMAASYNNLGVAYRNQGALDKALEYYLTSLQLYDSLQHKEGIATTKNNIANIYSMKKDYEKAMRYLEESHALFQEINDPFRLVGSMNNLGNLYHDIDLHDKALDYYNQAYALSEKHGARFGDAMNNVGNIYFNQGKYELAIANYQKALAIEREHNNKLGMLNTLTNIGITYTRARQPRNAERYLDEAAKLTEELQAYASLPAIYKATAENFAIQNKWKEAYQMQLMYDEAREKIHSDESTRNIAQMEMVLEFQQKERELELLKKVDEIKSLELYNTRLFIILTILGLIIVIGSINFFYMDRKRKLI